MSKFAKVSVVAMYVCAAASLAAAAAPDVKYFVPAGAERGRSSEIRIVGTLPKTPVRVWTSTDDLVFEPTKQADRYTVRVDADAAPGPRWVRFVNDDGASAARVFFVGAVAEIPEVEPNDAVDKAQPIEARTVVVNGALGKAADVDAFRVSLKAGETFVASVDAFNSFGSPFDGVLQITDAAGFVLQQTHDERGFDPLLEFAVPRDGDYVVRLFGIASVPNSSIKFAGAEDAVYRLTMTSEPFVEAAWPAVSAAPSGDASATATELQLRGWNVPADAMALFSPTLAAKNGSTALPRPVPHAHAGWAMASFTDGAVLVERDGDKQAMQTLEGPVTVNGLLSEPGQVDEYRFLAKKGDSLRFRVLGKTIGSPVDPIAHVYRPGGTLLVRLDDFSRTDNEIDSVLAAPLDGEYRIVLEDLFGGGGPRYRYVMSLRPASVDFALSTTAAEFTAVIGKPLEIPITIDRPRGMTADIEVRLEGCPEFADLAVTSPDKGAEAKKVTLTITPTKPFSGPIRITGTAKEPEVLHRTATAPLTLVPGGKIDMLWLTAGTTEPPPPAPVKKK